jgi:hypothetical protein
VISVNTKMGASLRTAKRLQLTGLPSSAANVT